MNKMCASIVLLLVAFMASCSDGGSSKPPAPRVGVQLLANANFRSWPHGDSVAGSFGGGSETAADWTTKWNVSAASKVVASNLKPGIRYAMTTGASGETYYLRQIYPMLKESLGKKFHVAFDVQLQSGDVLSGFYMNAEWNRTQRIQVMNTAASIQLSANRAVYSADFIMPTGPGGAWKTDDSAGIEVTFLFSVYSPTAVVNVYASSLAATN